MEATYVPRNLQGTVVRPTMPRVAVPVPRVAVPVITPSVPRVAVPVPRVVTPPRVAAPMVITTAPTVVTQTVPRVVTPPRVAAPTVPRVVTPPKISIPVSPRQITQGQFNPNDYLMAYLVPEMRLYAFSYKYRSLAPFEGELLQMILALPKRIRKEIDHPLLGKVIILRDPDSITYFWSGGSAYFVRKNNPRIGNIELRRSMAGLFPEFNLYDDNGNLIVDLNEF